MFFKDKSAVPQLVNQSLSAYEKGDTETAENLCIRILKLDSKNDSALVVLGNICFVRRNFKQAVKLYKKADSLKKNSTLIKGNLANALYEKGDFCGAKKYAEEALKLDSSNAMAYTVLGTACLALEMFDKAEEVFKTAVAVCGADAWNYNYLSQACEKKGLYEEAAAAAWKAVELAPEDDSQHLNLAYLLYDLYMEKQEEIIEKYARLWLEKCPRNQTAAHIANALLKNEKVEKAGAEYVKNTFDIFAPDFDSVLAKLNYKVPEYVFDDLRNFYEEGKKLKLQVLDAGCGTGLCGLKIKKQLPQSTLYGVDLSEKMLELSQKRKIYDELEVSELEAYLQTRKSKFDLIVAGDVFTYFGKLDSLFLLLFSALKKTGRIIFSVSENNVNSNDFFLHASGRFLHSENYIKTLLKKSGFSLEKTEKKHLRFEGEKDVFGYIVSAVKK